MKQYTVQITDRALADMEEIYTYIAEQLQAPEKCFTVPLILAGNC